MEPSHLRCQDIPRYVAPQIQEAQKEEVWTEMTCADRTEKQGMTQQYGALLVFLTNLCL